MVPRRRLVFVFVLVAVVLYLFLRHFAGAWVRWAWFDHLGLVEIYWRRVWARLETGLGAGVLFGLFAYVNLRLVVPALREGVQDPRGGPYVLWLRSSRLPRLLGLLAAVAGALAGWILSSQWSTVWFFRFATPFSTMDPIFHRNVADYVFRLPLYEVVYQFAGVSFWLVGLAVLATYFATGWLNFLDGRLQIHPWARRHVYGLVAAYLALKSVGYRLQAWNLLYDSTRGFTFGAGYADVHAALPAVRILMVIAALVALMGLAGVFGARVPLAWGVGGLAAASVLLATVYPALVEQLVVRPSQLSREEPYIADNIKATRQAFGLDSIQPQPFPLQNNLTAADLASFQDTFQNIRLWDWQIASPAFQQLQGLRSYYQFDPMTIDRYTVQGKYRQVLLSVREINYASLPNQTWVNEHLKFTHGYGAVVVPASQVGAQGMPDFWLQNISEQSSVGITLTQPRVYYGEQTTAYALVGPQIHEFDHPQGETDAYNQYTGTGGIPVGSWWQRLLFSMWVGDYNTLLSNQVGPGSRALIYRALNQSLPNLMGQPFLTYDHDPYAVIAGGRLYWIVDAYTTSDAYPFSTPYITPSGNQVSYMRNAVKVVVDAYNGTVTFYVADPTDPIIRTEERIFPGVFKPLAAMPSDLRAHIRYPEDMFSTQAAVYAKYHMTDPTVFYNNEDQWRAAKEVSVGTNPTPIPPYYVILQFPGMSKPQFVLMQPFTPMGAGRDNMAAWMAAFSDGSNYGKLVAYEFPKEQTVIGPLQVESQINQDSAVAQILTLWSQGGSQVLRGNLLVIPIRNSILYVEPLYQTASATSLPALRRVIVDYGGQQIAMGNSLDSALAQIFGPLPWAPGVTGQGTSQTTGTGLASSGTGSASSGTGSASSGTTPGTGLNAATLAQARATYAAAEQALRSGDLAGFASQISKLGQILSTAGTSAASTPSASATGSSTASGGSG